MSSRGPNSETSVTETKRTPRCPNSNPALRPCENVTLFGGSSHVRASGSRARTRYRQADPTQKRQSPKRNERRATQKCTIPALQRCAHLTLCQRASCVCASVSRTRTRCHQADPSHPTKKRQSLIRNEHRAAPKSARSLRYRLRRTKGSLRPSLTTRGSTTYPRAPSACAQPQLLSPLASQALQAALLLLCQAYYAHSRDSKKRSGRRAPWCARAFDPLTLCGKCKRDFGTERKRQFHA